MIKSTITGILASMASAETLGLTFRPDNTRCKLDSDSFPLPVWECDDEINMQSSETCSLDMRVIHSVLTLPDGMVCAYNEADGDDMYCNDGSKRSLKANTPDVYKRTRVGSCDI